MNRIPLICCKRYWNNLWNYFIIMVKEYT